MATNQTINVDFTPGLFQPTLYYVQGDVGRVFNLNLMGLDIPSGASVTLEATKPSGFGFVVEADSVVDNVATFTTTETMTAEWGRFPAGVHISSGSIEVGYASFLMVGQRKTHDESTIDGDAETVIPELTLLVQRVEAAAESVLGITVEAETLPAGSQATYSFDEETSTATFGIPQGEAGAGSAGVVADAYSASQTYAVGDYVIHEGSLYRCTTAITTAESFTASHWTQVVLADDVSDLKSDLGVNNDVLLSEADIYYPCYLENGDAVTIRTADNSVMSDNLIINFYSKTKTFTTGIWLLSGTNYKNSSYSNATPAYYARITSHPKDIVVHGGKKHRHAVFTMDLLTSDYIDDTVQIPTFDSDGRLVSVVHKNSNDETIRTDSITYATSTITEVRTLNTGENLTIVVNRTTRTMEVK